MAPGLLAANAGGEGVAAAAAVRVDDGGNQTTVTVLDAEQDPVVAVPIDLGPEGDVPKLQVTFGALRLRKRLELAEISVCGVEGGGSQLLEE